MREYSQCALGFMSRILPEYARSWKVDYASFRSIEERSRDLPLTKRNDLLHVDSFPTRPVFGDMILRCFTNVNPDQPREWLTSDPFAILAAGSRLRMRACRLCQRHRFGARYAARVPRECSASTGIPVVDRSPYDAFMLHFHDWLKANRRISGELSQISFRFAPGIHMAGIYGPGASRGSGRALALEQTVIVSRDGSGNSCESSGVHSGKHDRESAHGVSGPY